MRVEILIDESRCEQNEIRCGGPCQPKESLCWRFDGCVPRKYHFGDKPVCEDILETDCGLESAVTLDDLECYEITSQFSPCGDDERSEVFHDSQACDGRVDCSTGTDEDSCDGCAMECLTGLEDPCIPPGWVCDGIADCLDGKDEHRCLQGVSKDCFFSCLNNLPCLKTQHLGDGHWDCASGEDESPNHVEEALRGRWGTCSHTCSSVYGNTTCVPDAFTCDGDADCLGGGDEQMCDAVTTAPSHKGPGEYCPTISCFLPGAPDPYCLPTHLICDGHPDCMSEEDEQGCGGNLGGYVHAPVAMVQGPTGGMTGGQEPTAETSGEEPTYDNGATTEPSSFKEQEVADVDASGHGTKGRAIIWMTAAAVVVEVFLNYAW
ncbi:uncharacterized protein LOC144875432 [Branchiostoma floridae x Branchiostoma japonicum]